MSIGLDPDYDEVFGLGSGL